MREWGRSGAPGAAPEPPHSPSLRAPGRAAPPDGGGRLPAPDKTGSGGTGAGEGGARVKEKGG